MSITVESRNLNPYKDLTPEKKDKFINEEKLSISTTRTFYTRYTYKIHYNYAQRLEFLRDVFREIKNTFGLALFKAHAWKNVIKSCLGYGREQVLVQKSRIKLESLALQSLPNVSEEKKGHMQRELDQKQIPLNCQNPVQIKQPNMIHTNQIEEFLTEARENSWYQDNHAEWYTLRKKLFEGMEVIPFKDLMDSLKTCCQKLQSKLGSHEYAIGFVPKKSQQWMAELSVPYLDRSPSSFFEVATDNIFDIRGSQSALKNPVKRFVVFDDAAYSGHQLDTLISGLQQAILPIHGQEKCHLYLVVPFMSPHAVNLLQNNFKRNICIFGDKGHLKIHLMTSERPIKAMSDVLTENEMTRLISIENGLDTYCNGRTRNKCLSLMEWKVPDNASMPRPLKQQELYISEKKAYEVKRQFVTNYLPPYKNIK